MHFGVFDHVDDAGLPQADFFEARLTLVEALDRLGFHSYHTAEHHGTRLGLAASPSVYLAAVAQRTRRLKFGPLVYLPALYHPMRLAEEICMLDQMSRGRFQIGLGRGAVWIELADTGPGIKDEDKARVFDPYFTRNPDGTGLGLAIVNSIIAEHGGRINVEDNLPTGAKMVIELPIFEA